MGTRLHHKAGAPPPPARTGSARRCAGTAERPRLAVFRSNKHISAQVIDDDAGRTLAAALVDGGASSRGRAPAATSTPPAPSGSWSAERAKAAGITTVVFDRGGFAYHGRVAALADAARAEGLEF